MRKYSPGSFWTRTPTPAEFLQDRLALHGVAFADRRIACWLNQGVYAHYTGATELHRKKRAGGVRYFRTVILPLTFFWSNADAFPSCTGMTECADLTTRAWTKQIQLQTASDTA